MVCVYIDHFFGVRLLHRLCQHNDDILRLKLFPYFSLEISHAHYKYAAILSDVSLCQILLSVFPICISLLSSSVVCMLLHCICCDSLTLSLSFSLVFTLLRQIHRLCHNVDNGVFNVYAFLAPPDK